MQPYGYQFILGVICCSCWWRDLSFLLLRCTFLQNKIQVLRSTNMSSQLREERGQERKDQRPRSCDVLHHTEVYLISTITYYYVIVLI